MNENFKIKTSDFEGPFDLLLELIQKKKLSVNDVSLASITDEYISYVKDNELNLSDASYFVWTAATLMLLKSKSLLPKLSLGKDEEDDINHLKIRLRFLKEIKEVSKHLQENFGKSILFTKMYKKKIEVKFRPDDSITLKNVLMSLDGLVVRSPLIEKLPEVSVQKQKSLKEVIEDVTEKVNRFLKINFSELVLYNDKKEISVSFIAVLELFRNGKIDLEQSESFGNIVVEKKI
jgi:segregation and condensation protein A